MIGAAYALAVVLGLMAGRRHARETGAAGRPLLAACMVMGVAATLPVAAAVAIGAAGSLHLLLVVVYGLATMVCVRFLRPPVSIPGSKDPLEPVSDQPLLARIAEMAAAFSMKTPIVRLLKSTGGDLQALAFAGGLPRSSLIVTDGILHRLDPAERDGIIAHELAHVATRSLWVLMFATGAGWAVGFVAGHELPPLLGLLVAANTYMVVTRLAQRRYEILCDRRAADVVGVGTMRRALWKIHRVHVVPEQGFMSRLFYSTATHPHHAVRASALAVLDDDAGLAVQARREARPHGIASGVMFALWIGAIGLTVEMGNRPGWYVPLIAVLFAFLGKFLLLQIGLLFGRLRRQRRRIGFRARGTRWMQVGLVLCVGGLFVPSLPGPIPDVSVVIAGLVSNLIGMSLWFPAERYRRKVSGLILRHEWAAAIEAAESSSKQLARDPRIAHDVALCRVFDGDREGALAMLGRIADEWPQVLIAHQTRAVIRMGDEPEAALEHAREFQKHAPRDPAGPLLSARALVKLGRYDVAERAARAGKALEPEQATTDCVLAQIHILRGEEEDAAAACRRAFERAPGDAEVRLVRAQLAVAFEGREQARRHVAEAIETAEASPFSFLVSDAQRLSEALDARSDDSGSSEPCGPA